MIASHYSTWYDPPPARWLFEYFNVEVRDGVVAKFRKNRISGALYVFQHNCAPTGNTWHSAGYGFGRWRRIR